MTILSDSEIRDLCILPKTKLDQALLQNKLTQGTVDAVFLLNNEDQFQKLVEECRVPITEEDHRNFKPMIEPFSDTQIKSLAGISFDGNTVQSYRKIISRGLSSYGYDVSLAEEFKLFTSINSTIVDPKRLDDRCLADALIQRDEDGARYVVIPPNSYLLGRTIEYFRIPNDVMVIALGKSTYARAGAIVNVTPIEPGFEGNVVIEISNSTPLPMKIYANEGISQFLFFRGNQPASVSYADRAGKYQGQTGITLPTV